MRLLLVIGDLARRHGGPQTFIRDQAAALAARGHGVTLVATDSEVQGHSQRDPDWDIEIGTSCQVQRFRGYGPYAISPAMLKPLYEEVQSADIVHLHGMYKAPCSLGSWFAHRTATPYFVHLHGAGTNYHHAQKRWKKEPFERLVLRRELRNAAGVIALSELERRESMQNLSIPHVEVVPPPVAPPAALPDRLAAAAYCERMWGVRPSAQVVVFIGRLAEKKGVPILVSAFARATEELPDTQLVIAGADDKSAIGAGVEQEIAGSALGQRVIFTGHVGSREKAMLLARSEVFALPSADESFGLAPVEAMGAGVPVVVTPQVAVAQMVSEAGAGCVAERDSASFGAALYHVLSSPNRDRLGARGACLVRERFNPEGAIAALERLYDAALRD